MCPACLASAALIALGTTSAGGFTALLMKKALLKAVPHEETSSDDENKVDERAHIERILSHD